MTKFFIAKYTEDTDSIPCVLGKIVSGVNPLGNIRDLTADIYQKDVLDAIINLIGTVIDVADGFKVAGKVGKFLLKNADDVGVYSAIIRFINTKCPDLLKYLGKNDEFVEATKKVSLVKDQKMTKSEYDEISDALSKAGLEYMLKKYGFFEYLDQLNEFSENKIHHIINGSKNSNHGWEKLVSDKNWNDIKNIIAEVMDIGVEGSYKSVYSKIAKINGYDVEVTYAKLGDGTIKISDAWVRQE